MNRTKDAEMLAEAYKQINLQENFDPAIQELLGYLAVMSPMAIKLLLDQAKQKAAEEKANKGQPAISQPVSPEEQKAQMDANAPAYQRQQPSQSSAIQK